MPGPKHGPARRPGLRKVLVGYTKDKEPIFKDRTPNKKQAANLARRQAGFNAGRADSGLLCHMPGSQNRKK